MIRIGQCPACNEEIAAGGVLSPDDDATVQCPLCDEEFPQSKLALRDVPELKLSGVAAAPAPSSDAPTHLGESPAGKDDVQNAVPRQADEQGASPLDMPVIASSMSRAQEYDGRISTGSRSLQSPEPRSFFRQLVGIMGGGVVGLAMGYFILLWIGGPEKDFLEIGRRLPRWAVPAAFHDWDRGFVEFDRSDSERSLGGLLDGSRGDEGVRKFDGEVAIEGLPPSPAEETVDAVDSADEAVALVDPPQRGTADLEAALQAAEDARLALVGGELTDPAVRPMKDTAYKTFTGLAETLAVAAATPGREGEHDRFARQAEQLLRDALATDRMVEQLGRLAGAWLDSSTRDGAGVILAGRVVGSHMGIAGQRGILVELAGTSRAVAVVGPVGIDVLAETRVVVVGVLIEQPQQKIRGYTGSAREVVWAALVF